MRKVCHIQHLVKYMPAVVKEDYYENANRKYPLKERQDLNIVANILTDKDAYGEFLTNVLVHITGNTKLDKLYLAEAKYDNIVSVSDEAYGLLLIEDKSLLWSEVLKRRRDSEYGGGPKLGLKTLGVKKEVFISDKYGDSYTMWSNKGVNAPGTKKGWSNEGVGRFNEYVKIIKDFRETTAGKAALDDQRKLWTSSLLVANKKRRSDMIESESSEVAAPKIMCYQEDWD